MEQNNIDLQLMWIQSIYIVCGISFACFVQLQGILIGFVFVTQISSKLYLQNNIIRTTTTYEVLMTYFHVTANNCVLF